MPLLRCYRPKLDSTKSAFQFDGGSLPNYLKNVLIIERNDQKQDSITNKRITEKDFNNLIVNRSLNFNYFQKLVPNQRCRFIGYNPGWDKIKQTSDSNRSNKKEDKDHQTNYKFDFDSINIRLLETFGFIGTALVVGIDIRSRINQWSPVQHRREIHEYHHHLQHHSNSTIKNNVIQGFGLSSPSSSPYSENDLCRTTTLYCGSCKVCSYIFDKLFSLYFLTSGFPFSPSIKSISNIIDDKAIPSTSQIKVNDGDGQSRSPSTTNNNKNITINIREESELCQTEVEQSSVYESESNFLQTIFGHYENIDKQNRKSIIVKKEKDIWKNLNIEHDHHPLDLSQQINGLVENNLKHEATLTDVIINKPENQDKEDITDVLKRACIEYADQLNNLSGISLMANHRPDDAMSCWSSCEASSSALFNMGVAYESGRYEKNVDCCNCKPDMDLAYYYYVLAARMGHHHAIYNLALFYLYGKGKIEQDIERGVKLLRIASSKGVSPAQIFCRQFDQEKIKKMKKKFKNKKQNENKSNPQSYKCFDESLWSHERESIVTKMPPLPFGRHRSYSVPNLR